METLQSYDEKKAIVLGLDLGQKNDYSAICAIEIRQKYSPVKSPPYTVNTRYGEYELDGEPFYLVKHLHRWPLGTPYPDIVKDTGNLMSKLKDREQVGVTLIIDSTGCGNPVFDMFREARIQATGISIHGGSSVTREGKIFHVPKRDLVAVLVKLYQSDRITVSGKLPEHKTLNAELLNFRVKISDSGHDTYSAWRERDHDDIVLSVAVACWVAEKQKKNILWKQVSKEKLGIR